MNTERVAHSLNELKELSERMKRCQSQTPSAAVAMGWSVTLVTIMTDLEGATGVTIQGTKPVRAEGTGPVKDFSVETKHW